MSVLLKYIPGAQETYDEAVARNPYKLKFVPDYFKTQGMCTKALEEDPLSLQYVPNHLKTKEMCDKAVDIELCVLVFVPDHFETQESALIEGYVPDHFKMQGMCHKSVRYVPDWFVTQQKIKLWYDNYDDENYDEVIGWYQGYQKRNAQKAKIEKELMVITWHLSRW